jgi:hypothetical protein
MCLREKRTFLRFDIRPLSFSNVTLSAMVMQQ